jgi:enterochelin esterase family protein
VLDGLLDLIPPPPIRVWMDCGLQEWFITPNRQMYPKLKALGYDVTYHEQNSGHNYVAWRNVVGRGLMHLYGSAGA